MCSYSPINMNYSVDPNNWPPTDGQPTVRAMEGSGSSNYSAVTSASYVGSPVPGPSGIACKKKTTPLSTASQSFGFCIVCQSNKNDLTNHMLSHSKEDMVSALMGSGSKDTQQQLSSNSDLVFSAPLINYITPKTEASSNCSTPFTYIPSSSVSSGIINHNFNSQAGLDVTVSNASLGCVSNFNHVAPASEAANSYPSSSSNNFVGNSYKSSSSKTFYSGNNVANPVVLEAKPVMVQQPLIPQYEGKVFTHAPRFNSSYTPAFVNQPYMTSNNALISQQVPLLMLDTNKPQFIQINNQSNGILNNLQHQVLPGQQLQPNNTVPKVQIIPNQTPSPFQGTCIQANPVTFTQNAQTPRYVVIDNSVIPTNNVSLGSLFIASPSKTLNNVKNEPRLLTQPDQSGSRNTDFSGPSTSRVVKGQHIVHNQSLQGIKNSSSIPQQAPPSYSSAIRNITCIKKNTTESASSFETSSKKSSCPDADGSDAHFTTVQVGSNITISVPKDMANKKERLQQIINEELVRGIILNDTSPEKTQKSPAKVSNLQQLLPKMKTDASAKPWRLTNPCDSFGSLKEESLGEEACGRAYVENSETLQNLQGDPHCSQSIKEESSQFMSPFSEFITIEEQVIQPSTSESNLNPLVEAIVHSTNKGEFHNNPINRNDSDGDVDMEPLENSKKYVTSFTDLLKKDQSSDHTEEHKSNRGLDSTYPSSSSSFKVVELDQQNEENNNPEILSLNYKVTV